VGPRKATPIVKAGLKSRPRWPRPILPDTHLEIVDGTLLQKGHRVEATLGNVVDSQHQDVKRISDEDLFSLFPDRSMALIGQPGHQQLVFLDLPAPSSSSRIPTFLQAALRSGTIRW